MTLNMTGYISALSCMAYIVILPGVWNSWGRMYYKMTGNRLLWIWYLGREIWLLLRRLGYISWIWLPSSCLLYFQIPIFLTALQESSVPLGWMTKTDCGLLLPIKMFFVFGWIPGLWKRYRRWRIWLERSRFCILPVTTGEISILPWRERGSYAMIWWTIFGHVIIRNKAICWLTNLFVPWSLLWGACWSLPYEESPCWIWKREKACILC